MHAWHLKLCITHVQAVDFYELIDLWGTVTAVATKYILQAVTNLCQISRAVLTPCLNGTVYLCESTRIWQLWLQAAFP